ncbi:hypothetical protein K438DRAFT_1159401 [Mycena galopus ATCC 62051]|nr:hypothetical protein K438DRAFT_1159401 [Mycena galopus ATCC 62051]
MQIQPGWELYFDYAIYTSDVDPPPASVSTSSMSAAQQSPSGMISTPPTPPTPGASEEMTTVLTVSGGVSADYIMSMVTQPPEISTLIATSISQTLSGTPSTTSASLTHTGTSPILSGTSQAAGTVAATSSNITTIIRTAATPPVVPMISAFLGGALFATFVMVVCLICVRRQRSRNRKRAPWSFNAAGFRWHGTDGTGEPGDAREKCKSATDFDADSHFEGMTDEAE